MENHKECGFDKTEPCTEKCEYYFTCTRNPYFYAKEVKKDGGCKMD